MRDNIITYIHTYSRLPEARLRVGLSHAHAHAHVALLCLCSVCILPGLLVMVLHTCRHANLPVQYGAGPHLQVLSSHHRQASSSHQCQASRFSVRFHVEPPLGAEAASRRH